MQEQQRGEALVEIAIPCIPPGPSVLPQASTPVSQSAPAFFPGSLPIPSQPEFSHVRIRVNIYPDFFLGGGIAENAFLSQPLCFCVGLPY